jgi:D-glycero-beta-D-manno-heptose 1-phosphate adenylyltransferase
LAMVDAVIIFSEPTPRELIVEIRPDVLIKGGDYKIEEIAGAKEVIAWGGKVVLNPIVEGYSTTSIINKLQNK